MSAAQALSHESVLRLGDLPLPALTGLLERFGLQAVVILDNQCIPGSYWGECEAGLVGHTVYVRADTPVHSMLHEVAHCICMTAERRAALDKDAGGDYDEENAVCYLQILLADELAEIGRARMWRDMDAWGYTFRLGSAEAWFEQDAEDARLWLFRNGLIDEHRRLKWRCRS